MDIDKARIRSGAGQDWEGGGLRLGGDRGQMNPECPGRLNLE